MPIRGQDLYGTDLSGNHIEDYCIYCYKDGKFTEDVTMDEMIRLCSRYVEGNSRDVAIVSMKLLYPRLKRWARKEQTQNEYYRSINRVMEYIQGHLGEHTDLKTLAGIANISPYHFHRIFKSTIGESLAEYVQRLRLEFVAEQLKLSEFSLGELAEKTGYSSEQALSRAFKRYFSLPPTVFKASFFKEKFHDELVPRVCRVTEKYVITLKENTGGNNAWQKLYAYAMFNRLLPVESAWKRHFSVVASLISFTAVTISSIWRLPRSALCLIEPASPAACPARSAFVFVLAAISVTDAESSSIVPACSVEPCASV